VTFDDGKAGGWTKDVPADLIHLAGYVPPERFVLLETMKVACPPSFT
jgi:hypothetical protein